MTVEPAPAAKRQQWMPSADAQSDLERSLGDTRPWTDEHEVARRLEAWVRKHSDSTTLDALGCAEVAGGLREFTAKGYKATDAEAAGLVFMFMGNVARGRIATEYDMLADHLLVEGNAPGFSARTLRRWKHDHGGVAGLSAAVDRIQYELDLLGLIRGGRKLGAARQWLRNNPGKHAMDAPPPQRRGPGATP